MELPGSVQDTTKAVLNPILSVFFTGLSYTMALIEGKAYGQYLELTCLKTELKVV